ncbi:hypothetical protein EPUS_08161 [Endocarpon pusillum Z07020]|uniref:Uncharacterized protein n=1 Tax=Endocarpon pusillum (strain Z07020 / HMAS-L-300199) TaxID=1263415 RepID=U1GGL2_ENDPU|nr:uncharacterized protein EPUS_08161 [Endocarpon pusillum Z07020]ERF71243.1 hypothetical protein EPUS_08161 [Endocarpon pusillum Z07020]
MDIPSRQFSSELLKILQLIADSHFVALDLEFSGISSRRTRAGKSRLSLQQVYEDVREAAKQYQVLQVGLTVVEEDARKGVYVLRPYNFFINPIPAKEEYNRIERIWSYQSGAVSFLLKNKFRFDLPFSEGIMYLSRKEERQIRASWAVRDAEREALEDMTLKADDKPLVDHIHLSVQKWLSQPLVDREDYLNIPHTTEEKPRIKHIPAVLNRYQVRVTHQVIRKDYAHLKTLGRDGFVRITLRNEKEDAEQKLRQERYREQDVVQAIEFRWIIEALCGGDISKIPERCFLANILNDKNPSNDDASRKQYIEELQRKLSTRRRVLFGHNCFIDLVYLYACFIGDLPEKIEDFQELIHGFFPAVVDTKYLASLVKELRFNSNLEALEKEMRTEEAPAINVPVAFDRYVWGEHFHEAGFDSFMTAKIAIKLSAKLEKEGKLREAAKPQKIIKAGETILIDSAVDIEEEQMEDYVTAPESAADTDSIVNELESKLAVVFSSPAKKTFEMSQPFDARKLPDGRGLPDTYRQTQPEVPSKGEGIKPTGQMRDEPQPEPSQHSNSSLTPQDDKLTLDTSSTSTPVVAVKEKVVGWRSPVEVKRIKNGLAHNSMLDVLDTPVGPNTEDTSFPEHDTITKIIPREDENAKHPETDLLVWSDRDEDDDDEEDHEEEAEGENANAAGEAIPIEAEESEKPMTAQELEDRINKMSAKGDMMPRWESESGIWKVIGNKLIVNACEEGVCLL